MLQVSQLSRSFGAHDVFTGASFVLNQGERIGLIGPNGCGKSTLLRCIAGVERADRGSVALAPGASLGYLAQDIVLVQIIGGVPVPEPVDPRKFGR